MAIPLSELTEEIALLIEDAYAFGPVWVLADLSNHTHYPAKGHHYFELVEKDEGGGLKAKLQAVAWRPGNAAIKRFEAETGRRFANGIGIMVQLQLEFHPVYGLKGILVDIDAAYTIGQLEREKAETVKRLLAECSGTVRMEEGRLRSSNSDLPLPPVVQRIALLASGASAGYQDFMHTLQENSFGYRFQVTPFFITTQGAAQAEAVAGRINALGTVAGQFDAAVLLRGGGSDTDFLLFDQFALCRAVAALEVPLITGLGHQKNETLSDLLAHTATKTPTRAAELIIARNRAFEEEVLECRSLLATAARHTLSGERERLGGLQSAIVQAGRAALQWEGERLARAEDALRLLHPDRVLERGYALVYRNGQWTASGKDLAEGEELEIQMHDFRITVTVSKKEPR